jgi:serine/threonine protein kinase
MSRPKRFHEELARFYAPKTILAVNFLHKRRIIHRDIKPGNILLDRGGHCKLSNFRLPKVGTFKGMRTEDVCGTDGYRAPEIHQGSPYGPEVDWTVGWLMFDMMVGECRPERHPLYLTKDAVSIINVPEPESKTSPRSVR